MAKDTETLPLVLLVLSSFCAMVMTGLVLHREFGSTQPATAATTEVREWEVIAGADSTLRKTGNATLVVFTDYQCPFCRNFESVVDSVRTLFGDSVRVVMRHFPLETIHPFARDAAMAAECARVQGSFDEYHRALFAQQALIGKKPWTEFAVQAAVADTVRFLNCINSSATATAVTEQTALGDRLNITATPTVLLNETQFGDPPSIGELAARIRRLLNEG